MDFHGPRLGRLYGIATEPIAAFLYVTALSAISILVAASTAAANPISGKGANVTLSQLLKLILSLLTNPPEYVLFPKFFLKIVLGRWLVLECLSFGSSKPPILCHAIKPKSCERYPQGILLLKAIIDITQLLEEQFSPNFLLDFSTELRWLKLQKSL
ncbi:hypothetical protein M9H77_23110 [Catharanthus roseus]|uniref:Uncharacterized protein n=1 Tax=Catharanthus roseus TaxID=4058 RepID=A0ACC0ATL3_CATRO|nr:hypothetical protein M9H77_23110 [Catharanthus roseus]